MTQNKLKFKKIYLAFTEEINKKFEREREVKNNIKTT